MINQIRQAKASEVLRLYLDYLKNQKNYTQKEKDEIEAAFDEYDY